MKIKLSDGNSVELFENIEDAAIAAYAWYFFRLPSLPWHDEFLGKDDEPTIDELNDYILHIENLIAESKGYRNSSVSARCQMGLNLSAEIIDD